VYIRFHSSICWSVHVLTEQQKVLESLIMVERFCVTSVTGDALIVCRQDHASPDTKYPATPECAAVEKFKFV